MTVPTVPSKRLVIQESNASVPSEGQVIQESNASSALAPDTSKTSKVVTLEILKVIKDAQQQHGLRHSDYQRYRGYCTRRIRRLRKVLHIPQGDKRHFKRRDVTEDKVKDERFLTIPLMLSERAWSHAMQLRQEANTEPRKRFHLIQRLRKATVYALQLQTLCESNKCDARTKLEAQAYVAWMHGSLHFELQMWKPAIENLNKAKMVYEKLTSALGEEEQVVYRQRCDELAPSLRYCAYNIGDQTAMDDLLSIRSQAHGDLLDNLDTLMAQTRERKSEALSEATWRGHTFPVKPESVRVFLLADRALEGSLTSSSSATERITQLEKHLMACKEAIAAAREEMKNDPASKSRTGGPLTPLQCLISYLTYIRLTRTIQRNNLFVEAAKAAMADKISADKTLADKTSADKASADKTSETEGRKTKPQDLPRLYEIILQNLTELQQLPGLEDDREYQQELDAKILAYKALRCFYIAEVLSGLRRWREAGAMYQRAEGYAHKAQSQVPDMRDALTQLIEEVDGARYSSLAHAVLEDDSGDTPAQAITGKAKKKIPLVDRLDEYCEDPALASKQPNVMKLPPDMQPVPCKPLFFDLALNLVKYPSLEDKIDTPGKKANQAGLTGFVKGLWGWGNK